MEAADNTVRLDRREYDALIEELEGLRDRVSVYERTGDTGSASV